VSGWTAADQHAWQVLAPLAGEYLPWSSAALRPSALVAVLNDIVVHDRASVLECGGGISTVYIARLLTRRGRGELVTLEHDDGWVAFLREALARERLVERVTLVHAPLAEHPLAWEGEWYDEAALPDGPIDLLVVDGPPAWAPGTERARYPALPVLLDRLTAEATVVLDDLARPGEQAVLERWEAETAWRFERRHEDGGIAIGRAGGLAPLGA
jgi:predicted O-methyltransferase YrrM